MLASCDQGGMKAVLWADTIQTSVMLAGLLAVFIRGCIDVGGLQKVFDAARDQGRLNLNRFVFCSWLQSCNRGIDVFLVSSSSLFAIF